jgi:hypothetical protein
METLSIYLGFLAIIGVRLFQPPDGYRATGSSILAVGSGSKATGAIEHQDLRLSVSVIFTQPQAVRPH